MGICRCKEGKSCSVHFFRRHANPEKYEEEKKKNPKAKKPKQSKGKSSDERLADTIKLELNLAKALATDMVKEELAKHKDIKSVDKSLQTYLYLAAGENDKAIKIATDEQKKNQSKVIYETNLIMTLHMAGKKEEAKKAFENK